MKENYFKIVKKKILKELYVTYNFQSIAHKSEHINRVLNTALIISHNYNNVDVEVLKISVLLHDIAQPYNDKKNHVKLSINMASSILKDINYPNNKIKKVLNVISEHSTENMKKKKFTSIESKILFDADKIDGIGASGISRVFSLFDQMNKEPLESIKWYKNKINIAIGNLQTKTGKKIFKKRLIFTNIFLDKLIKENKHLKKSNKT